MSDFRDYARWVLSLIGRGVEGVVGLLVAVPLFLLLYVVGIALIMTFLGAMVGAVALVFHVPVGPDILPAMFVVANAAEGAELLRLPDLYRNRAFRRGISPVLTVS